MTGGRKAPSDGAPKMTIDTLSSCCATAPPPVAIAPISSAATAASLVGFGMVIVSSRILVSSR